MKEIKVNLENLTDKERKQLLKLIDKANNQVQLCDVEDGDIFKIGDVEFIKFSDENGVTTAVTKDIVFNSDFGEDNNLVKSEVIKKLNDKFLPKIVDVVGYHNIVTFETDLTTLDGLTPYGVMTSKISLPTFDFYRKNVKVFDRYKLDKWWWLATPDSAKPHYDPVWASCVAPSGSVDFNNYYCNYGVRPFLKFVSSIFVSCED